MGNSQPFLELIRRAATDLSPDVEAVLKKALGSEAAGSPAADVMSTILENVRQARENSTPICQDTGSLIFYIDHPVGGAEPPLRAAIEDAAVEATRRQYLRPNAVDPVDGKNSGNNLGIHAPTIYFHQWENPDTRVRLMLKGGGCENVGAQYKLPFGPVKAGRDLDGVRRVVIDAVLKAQGLGCAPGFIGIGIGGGRATSYTLSKEQFFRRVGERSPRPELARLEEQLNLELNRLEIGPMGFGGKNTVLDVFAGAQHRHPATFYVSVSYMCWAFRRKSMMIRNGEVTHD